MSYSVVLSDGHLLKRHLDHLHKRTIDATTNSSEINGDDCLPPLTRGNDSNNVVPDVPLPLQHSSRIRRSPDNYTPGTGHQ